MSPALVARDPAHRFSRNPLQADAVQRVAINTAPYDTGATLRFNTRRWNRAPLPGVVERDDGLKAHGSAPLGDLSVALDLAPHDAPIALRLP